MRRPPVPPHPSGSPLTNAVRFFSDPFELFRSAMEECGDVFSLRLPGIGDWIVVCSPETLRQAYEAEPGTLVSGELLAKMVGFMLGTSSTAFFDGPEHKARQQQILPILNGSVTLRYVDSMRCATETSIAKLPAGESFAMMPVLHRMTLEVIIRVLLGLEPEGKIGELIDDYDQFTEKCLRSPLLAIPFLQIDLGALSPWGRILRLRETTRQIFRDIIAERRRRDGEGGPKNSEGRTDVLAELMHGARGHGEGLEDSSLLDEIFNLLFAGHETTSTSLGWILALILEHAEVERKVREEIDRVLAKDPVERAHLPKLEYLEATINEGLRLGRRTPFTGLRLVKKPFEVGGYEIAPGKVIALSHFAVCSREDVYERAERFEPERFVEKRVSLEHWSPFGRGERACAGRGLAMVELKVVLATLMQRVRLALAKPARKAVRRGFLFEPQHRLRVTLLEHRA